ncbi:MAG TPA: DNA-3-methyladenine glycosylase [Acidobacteriota bacterium]|jgi:DNA-3-methyladenine glycosylase
MPRSSFPRPLPRKFFNRNALEVTRELMGKTLVRFLDHDVLTGRIVEAEAYIGEDDPACHAFRGLTPRTRVMYGPPGFSYVYFTYGMYFMLNVVCEREGFPAAVLLRAVEPLEGLDKMLELRKTAEPSKVANGPGKLCVAFDIKSELNAIDLTSKVSNLQICAGQEVPTVKWSSRVGIREGTDKKWRCYIPGNRFVSPGKTVLSQ